MSAQILTGKTYPATPPGKARPCSIAWVNSSENAAISL